MEPMHPYQKVIDEIVASEGKISGAENAYKLLFKLSKVKGMGMNGNKTAIAKEFRVTPKQVMNLAKEALDHYIATDALHLPPIFLFRKKKNYMHDGEATANRNLWSENRKIYTGGKKTLPEYPLNTISK